MAALSSTVVHGVSLLYASCMLLLQFVFDGCQKLTQEYQTQYNYQPPWQIDGQWLVLRLGRW